MFYQVHLILIRIYQSGERKVTRWHFAGVYDFFANSIHTACNIITEMHTTYQCQSELQIALTCWLDASFPFVKRSPYKIQLNRMQCVASLMSIIQLNKSHLVNWRTPTCDDHNFVCATPIGSSSYIVIDSQCILSQSYRFTMSRDGHEIKLFDRPWNWCPAFIEWSELYLQSVKSPPLTSLMPLIATTQNTTQWEYNNRLCLDIIDHRMIWFVCGMCACMKNGTILQHSAAHNNHDDDAEHHRD